ncbi:EamA family transporter [Mucilaginibacter ginsenosidivorans]|uniref:EamA family transporter n=2 Tax=Mucilaginibacter ginsenosidivorans TaxID=398053 RepID=A0A5B8V3C2_9SPHI|nr:EamA family transporter [Mucilaginibacter ginsenosidivorans]
MVIIAFATVYLVWGSTYFFIRMAIQGIPPLFMGAMRFFTAGIIMLTWCIIKGEKIFIRKSLITSAIVGLLLLGGGNGVVIWVEQTLPSAMVAILVSAAPIWFVLLDRQNWGINFRSRSTVIGLIVGFIGVLLLFGEQLDGMFGSSNSGVKIFSMVLLIFGSISWSAGSIYSKHHPSEGSAAVNVAWQMIIAGIVFLPGSLLNHEFSGLNLSNVPVQSWLALVYLILFGSIAAFSAYVWLLQVRPATQVSTYAYVNPVIAVVLGVLFAREHISLMQISGLVVILVSVLLINLSKYRKDKGTKDIVVKPESGPSKERIHQPHSEATTNELCIAANVK